MRTIGSLVALATLVSLVGLAEAQTIRGQVQSITITHCDLKPGNCEGYITLTTDQGVRQVLVTRDTEITRVGKPILLGELGTGNVVTLHDTEPVPGTGGAVRPRRIQSP